MARGVSTVLDVAICLLLVGAAVATLSTAPPAASDEGPDADDLARTVATSTAAVPFRDDTRHTTLAAHLAAAAVADATLDGRRLLETAYPDAVGNATADAVGPRSFVTATWAPHRNASVRGRITAGDRPPANADVAATTLTVDTGIDPPGPNETGSFAALARALADALVEYLFPPSRTRVALGDPRTEPDTGDRYRAVAHTVDEDVEAAVDDGDVRAANESLSRALAAELEADLRAEYGSPAAAANAVTVEQATVVVRRWEHG